jgi:putative salt-induced outer membrane protein YdiY
MRVGELCVLTVACAGIAAAAVAQDEEAIEAAEPRNWLQGWEGSVSLGLNGSSGNTELFNARAGADFARLTERFETTAALSYLYGVEDGSMTEHKFGAVARNDWLIPDSRWRLFARGNFDFDEFKDWKYRISGFVGPAYEFIGTDRTQLLGRIGVGLTKEFGGSENRIMPEGLLGADFSHQITDRQKVSATADYMPALDEFGPYRLYGRAVYEVVLDEQTNLNFRTGVESWYDSTPGEGFKRADVSYFAVLAWTF